MPGVMFLGGFQTDVVTGVGALATAGDAMMIGQTFFTAAAADRSKRRVSMPTQVFLLWFFILSSEE